MGNSTAAPAKVDAPTTRVFACSDLHVDHHSNWLHLQAVVQEGGYTGRDVLIVAGDVSTELALLRRTLAFLAGVFHGDADLGEDDDDEEEESQDSAEKRKQRKAPRMSNVFFCPGNNELRLARSDKKDNRRTSLDKLAEVLRVCEEEGVHTRPAKINGQVWIVPLLAWYSPSFDPQWDGQHDYQRGWLDFRACAWPSRLDDQVGGVADHFLALNEAWMSMLPFDAPVVSFSHFLPRFELLPRRTFLHNKTLPLVVGHDRLDEQIRRIQSRVHVFGHTHIDKDKTIDGVRYVQNAFGHPSERKQPWRILSAPYRPKLVLHISSADPADVDSSESDGEECDTRGEKEAKDLEEEEEEERAAETERKGKRRK